MFKTLKAWLSSWAATTSAPVTRPTEAQPCAWPLFSPSPAACPEPSRIDSDADEFEGSTPD